jgi:hypothetical protein
MAGDWAGEMGWHIGFVLNISNWALVLETTALYLF